MRRRAGWILLILPLLVPFTAYALANLTASPSSVTFPARCVRTSAAPSPITITNEGNRDATDVRVQISPSAFASLFPLTGATSVPTLAPSAEARVSVGFVPGKAGTQSAHARIRYTTQDPPKEEETPAPQTRSTSVPVAGDGIDRFIDASPRALNFGDVRVGREAAERIVTVYDDGDSPLTITGVEITGRNAGDFSVRPRGSRTISDGAPLRLRVGFTARGVGSRRATLRITSNACTDPTVTVDLGGAGVVQDVIALPGRVDFEPILPGERARRDVAIANQGGSDLRVSRVRLAGSDAADFRLSRVPTLPRTLDPGENFNVRVRFIAPDEITRSEERRAHLFVRSNDPDSERLRVRLVGTVEPPEPSPTPSASETPTAAPSPTASPPAPSGGAFFGEYADELVVAAAVAGFFFLLVAVRRVRHVPD